MTNANETSALLILKKVLDAIQDAEEMGGPTGMAYIHLMESISRQANDRCRVYSDSIHRRAATALAQIDTDEDGQRVMAIDSELLRPIAKEFNLSVDDVLEIYEYFELRP